MGNQIQSGADGGKVVGKCVIGLASILASRIEWSIAEAERLLGCPPNTPEVACVF